MFNPSTSSPTTQPAAPHTHTAGLDGALLARTTLLLIGLGVLGDALFIVAYVVEGAARPGYSGLRFSISSLSLGPDGWMQQANFILFGVLLIVSAFGWRTALKPGTGAIWYPLLKGVIGITLIVAGGFSQDPAVGYPPGAVAGANSVHGTIHDLAAFVSITALAVSVILLGVRFARERRWRLWAPFAILIGISAIVFIAIFGALNGRPGAPAGLFERLAVGIEPVLMVAIFVRLLSDRRTRGGRGTS
jgi:hypothetical protein